MQLTNCPGCGKLIVPSNFRDVCDNCFRFEEEEFKKVTTFLRVRENRSATMPQICEGTGVTEELLLRFVKQRRFATGAFPNIGYYCERCGAVIQEGRLCRSCSSEIHEGLKKAEADLDRDRQIQQRNKRSSTFFH